MFIVQATANEAITSIAEQVALNKSSLLLKIQKQNTQTLQLFTVIIKTESTCKCHNNAKLVGLSAETKWSGYKWRVA